MRTIKFRGRKPNNEWLYGNLIHNQQDYFIFPVEAPNSYDYYRVCEKTVGEFTGFTDKNCVEIYEGDIVKIITVSDKNRLIQFSKGCFEVVSINNRSIAYNIDEYYCNDYEVVGNMFDNPELLQ